MKKVGFFKSIQFKFVLIYTLLILLAMQLIGVYFASTMKEQSRSSFEESLKQQATQLVYIVAEAIKETEQSDKTTMQQKMRAVQDALDDTSIRSRSGEIQVVSEKGKILATSDISNKEMVGKSTSNQIINKDRLTMEGSVHSRRDADSGERLLILTKPIKSEGETYGLLYIEKSMESMYSELSRTNGILATATGIALVITAVLGVVLARTITRPLGNLRQQTLAVSRGDFTRKVQFNDDDEIGQLAIAFNAMTDKLHEANAKTEAERRRLRSVLTYMTDGVIATTRDGTIDLMNNRSEELLRLKHQQAKNHSIIDVLDIEDQFEVDDLYDYDDFIILDFSTKYENQLIRANFSVLKNEYGAITGLIAVLHDVTEQQQLEMERREFVANVSHELRTPLTTMKSYLEALDEGAIENKELAGKFLGVTQNEVDRMTRLVKDLLQLSKMDASNTEFHKVQIDIVVLIDHIVDRFEMSKTQHIDFERNLWDEPVYVDIDKDKITQVIDNIVSNAMKYSPDGGTITIDMEKDSHEVTLSISDEGVGIPEENVDKVFDRFYRVDKARSRKLGGTGLGLAIAKEIIAAHDGDIWAESQWGQGTTIRFTLPLLKGGLENET
ncbi:cell wall metabolism sensor histidine kinase WalK [Tuberibacillus sp. Marseille-P3662]|uniref:cell wall metabolism sensor histidine kinase WalK n=1 Tax=Tuberibacillus sp. Marseille-P3662 TaxID=1965358 RepID=UPI000A1CBB85|nr:cell wall metabolism sensor histidine kinase WalK [Tuberibacillus sp. Marseille-P3662]